MEHNLEKLKKLKKISLSEVERATLRAKLAYYIAETPIAQRQSRLELFATHGLRVVLSSFLFIILFGGSVSALANSSLPGDPLYAFKLNVNEEIKGLLSKTPEQKVAWQQERIENRLNEIKLLADSQTLTKEKQAVVQKALSNHANDLSTELTTLSVNQPDAALKATAQIEESLRVQKDSIASTISADQSDQKADVLKTVDDTIASVAHDQDKIIQNQINKASDDTSNDDPIDNVSDAINPAQPESSTSTPANPPASTTVTPAEP